MVNKATFIYYCNEGEQWSTPMSILREFERRGWECKIYSLKGEDGEYIHNNLIKFGYDCMSGYTPDIVLFFDYGRYDSHLLDKILSSSAYWVMESGDDPQNFDKNFPKSHKFDLIHTPDHQSYLKYKESGRTVIHLPHFADSTIHDSYGGSDAYPAVRSTRGKGGSPLMDYLENVMPKKFINKNGMVGTDYGLFLNNGLITLQHSRHGEVTRRIFEGMACGTLVITDRLSKDTNIDSLFTEGEDIVYYDDISDCISKINYYLHNGEERMRISKNGYIKVHALHTQVQRVDEILKCYYQYGAVC